jgi:ABC-type transporter Mla subunit MlaD
VPNTTNNEGHIRTSAPDLPLIIEQLQDQLDNLTATVRALQTQLDQQSARIAALERT